MTLSEKLNIQVGSNECLNQDAVIFCFQNMIKRFSVEPSIIEEALNDAGYYSDEGDYSDDDISLLCEIASDCGAAMQKGEILDKAIWFDTK